MDDEDDHHRGCARDHHRLRKLAAASPRAPPCRRRDRGRADPRCASARDGGGNRSPLDATPDDARSYTGAPCGPRIDALEQTFKDVAAEEIAYPVNIPAVSRVDRFGITDGAVRVSIRFRTPGEPDVEVNGRALPQKGAWAERVAKAVKTAAKSAPATIEVTIIGGEPSEIAALFAADRLGAPEYDVRLMVRRHMPKEGQSMEEAQAEMAAEAQALSLTIQNCLPLADLFGDVAADDVNNKLVRVLLESPAVVRTCACEGVDIDTFERLVLQKFRPELGWLKLAHSPDGPAYQGAADYIAPMNGFARWLSELPADARTSGVSF